MMISRMADGEKMKQVKKDGNVVRLIQIIRGISREMTTNAPLYDAIDEAKRRYYSYCQQPDGDNGKHQRNYMSNVDVVEHH